MKEDIKTREDIQVLVNEFYNKVNKDELLAPVFGHVDWVKHLPVMYNFWSSMLLGDRTYEGNPFQKHIDLPIQSRHFNQWLLLFVKTVDENFQGAKADETKQRANSIAQIFQHKLKLS
ncbi:MAG TPA: group III truncated hemoglobin [Chryseolinea sp.]|nr:group III truncated hemoglobin [Chryseolinea sp.]